MSHEIILRENDSFDDIVASDWPTSGVHVEIRLTRGVLPAQAEWLRSKLEEHVLEAVDDEHETISIPRLDRAATQFDDSEASVEELTLTVNPPSGFDTTRVKEIDQTITVEI